VKADLAIKAAKAEVGYHEGFRDGHWNNIEKYAGHVPGLEWAQGEAWCAVFNCWLDLQAGLKPNVDFPLTASCDVAAAWFKKHGRLSQYPAIGAWVLFGSAADYVHTGRVVNYDDTYIYTIEGNTNTSGSREGDGVYSKKHLRRDPHVAAYGYPKFPDGIKSADPAFKSQAPKTPTRVATAGVAVVVAAGAATAVAHQTDKPAPKPVPVVKVSTVKSTGGCVLKVTNGKAKYTGTCVITVAKAK
jgi:hypothetical protein